MEIFVILYGDCHVFVAYRMVLCYDGKKSEDVPRVFWVDCESALKTLNKSFYFLAFFIILD